MDTPDKLLSLIPVAISAKIVRGFLPDEKEGNIFDVRRLK